MANRINITDGSYFVADNITIKEFLNTKTSSATDIKK